MTGFYGPGQVCIEGDVTMYSRIVNEPAQTTLKRCRTVALTSQSQFGSWQISQRCSDFQRPHFEQMTSFWK